jgi:hypothetical protein
MASGDIGGSKAQLRFFQGGNKLHFPFTVKGVYTIFALKSGLLHTLFAMPRFPWHGASGVLPTPCFADPRRLRLFRPPISRLRGLSTELSTISLFY